MFTRACALRTAQYTGAATAHARGTLTAAPLYFDSSGGGGPEPGGQHVPAL